MADYWKSQARKFCDFCKCWISDNKPSIEFHESGKKHKENVSKRLKEIHKNSAKQAKQQKKFDKDMETMERAAMEAYMKDVENNTRDMTADSIIQQKWSKQQSQQEAVDSSQLSEAVPEAHPRFHQSTSGGTYGAYDIDPLDPLAKQKLARLEAQQKAKISKQAKKEKRESEKKKSETSKEEAKKSQSKLLQNKVWYEARSQGYSYYWNIHTNETVWEPPAEGFMSLAEQAEEAQEQALQESLFEQIDKEKEQERAVILEEQRANAEREKLKNIRKRFHESKTSDTGEESVSTEETVPYRRDYSVPEKPQPYGSWQVVRTTKTDLQLPKKEEVQVIVPPSDVEEPLPKKVFKEKTITSLKTEDSDDESSGISFKKRTFGKRSVRKRVEDD